jgi:hypothetical protein
MNANCLDDAIIERIQYNNLPDKEIEIYWYEFKNIVTNCFHSIDESLPLEFSPISTRLNQLQKDNKYKEIEECIQNYISIVCQLYVTHNCPTYQCNLLDTQIKRWNRISTNSPFFTSKDARIFNKSCVIFYIYSKYITYKRKYLVFDMFFRKKTYEIDDLYELVDISILHKYPYFLDKLRHCIDITAHINNKYGRCMHKDTSGSKILAALK